MMQRRDVWRVRAIESDGKEEGFAGFVRMMFLHQLHGGERGLSIGMFLVFAVEQEPAHRAAVRAGAQGDHFILPRAVDADGIDNLVPGSLVVLAIGADLGGYAVMVYFTYSRGKVTVIDKMLRERSDVWLFIPEMAGIGQYSGLLRVETGHK